MSHWSTHDVDNPEETAALSRGKSGFIRYLFRPHGGGNIKYLREEKYKQNCSWTSRLPEDTQKPVTTRSFFWLTLQYIITSCWHKL